MAQFRTDKQKFLNNGNTIFEVVMLSTNTGSPISTSNRLPVTLGSDTITISGNVIVGSVVTVNSSPSNPVHTHITEVGTSGILNVNYLPVAGNVSIHHSNGANITSTVPLPTYVTSIPNLDNAPWEIQVARGLVANVSSLYRNAYNPDCAKDTEETIWYEGG